MNMSNPPVGYESGFKRLVWELREYGVPINQDTVEWIREYLEQNGKSADEADYTVVAQWLDQHKPVEIQTNNNYGVKQLRFSDFA